MAMSREDMNALYKLDYNLASKVYPWKKRPTGVAAQRGLCPRRVCGQMLARNRSLST